MRKPREAYVRVTEVFDGVECILGLELRVTESAAPMYKAVRDALRDCRWDLPDWNWRTPVDDGVIASLIERRVKSYWPDRAYFVEVCHDQNGQEWVQLFQPWTEGPGEAT